MSDKLRFVTFVDGNNEVARVIKDLKEFFGQADQEKEFLEKRLQALKQQKEDKWKSIKETLVRERLITQKEADDGSIIISNRMTEIFVDEDGSDSGLRNLIDTLARL